MRRHLRILDFAISGLWRRRSQTCMILVVYFFVVFALASVILMIGALKKEAALLLESTPELIVQRVSAGRHDWIPVEYAEKILDIRGVREVTPRFWGYYFDPPTGANYTFMGFENLPAEILSSIDGQGFDVSEPWSCVIGRGVAEIRLLEEEDILPVKGSDGELYVLRVKGVFETGSQLLTNDVVLMQLDAWKRIFAVEPGRATDLVVMIPNVLEIDTITRKILERFPDVRPIRKDMVLRTYDALFDWRGTLVLVFMSGGLAAFAVFAWDRAASLGGKESREVGILKALGWDISDIIELKMWEGFAISSLAFLGGVIAAHLHVFVFGCRLFAPLLKGWSVVFPEFELRPEAELLQILSIFFLSVVPYVLVTLIPAWKAAVTDPDLAMRR
ncbi:MAG: FtsX-like permease family protein [Acidobacteriota bacterium]|nr:MAG: FtsX-like permease family protein [Acidobacteriota bacterium]